MRSVALAASSTVVLASFAWAEPPSAPSDFTATVTSATSIRLEWVDNSSDETGFQIFQSVGINGTFSLLGPVPPNVVSASISNRTQSTTYRYLIRSFNSSGPEYSDFVGPVTVSTPPPVVASPNFINGLLQTPFSFHITSSFPNSATGYTITALPPGLSLDSATGAITGTPTAAGRTDGQVTITHNGYPDAISPMSFEIYINPPALLPPVIVSPLIDIPLTAGSAATTIPVAAVFTDPDVSSAARLSTDLGTIDFAFYQDTAPQTVANFLGYLDRGDFVNTMFHRSVPGFIIQGGAFRADSTASAVPTQAPVINEPRITNLAGTVAMAKQAGNPDSATNQFFINLADNADILDPQNEGFTVFARVAANGMAVANAIVSLPHQNFSTTNSALTDTPVRISPPPAGAVPYDPSQLVRISSASRISPLSLAVISSDPAVATAIVTGTDLQVTPIISGTTTLTLTATDLDGQATTSTLLVTVGYDSYPLWTDRQPFALPADSLPTADSDHDDQSNLIEYALASSPTIGSPAAISSSVESGHLTGSFTVRNFLSDTNVALETAATLEGPWITRWNLTDGFTHPWISSHEAATEATLVHFRDPGPASEARLFLRLKITGP